ncbi:MAG TPA: phosphoribosyltransferase [Actinoallomurus sp.]|nr:phosphoribosyltransferase [Actinoallomurus sp.]
MGSSGHGVRLPFTDRAEAGRVLAGRVASLGLTDPVVLALPRGGVPVAHEIAERLGVPFDVLVTRKIGCPGQPELGVGAIAEGGEPVFDAELLRRLGLTERDLDTTTKRERAELTRRVSAYRGDRALPPIKGRDAVVVDDGLATGGTARAALGAVRGEGAARVVLAVPVGAAQTVLELSADADDVVVLAAPSAFRAVGQWYQHFEQLTDADVLALL